MYNSDRQKGRQNLPLDVFVGEIPSPQGEIPSPQGWPMELLPCDIFFWELSEVWPILQGGPLSPIVIYGVLTPINGRK